MTDFAPHKLNALFAHIARTAPFRVELSTGAVWVLYEEHPGFLTLMPDGEGTDDQTDVACVYATPGWEGQRLPAALHEPDGTVHLCEDLAPDFEIISIPLREVLELRGIPQADHAESWPDVGVLHVCVQHPDLLPVALKDLLDRDVDLYIRTVRSYIEQRVLPYTVYGKVLTGEYSLHPEWGDWLPDPQPPLAPFPDTGRCELCGQQVVCDRCEGLA
jgi:hypothetical protein